MRTSQMLRSAVMMMNKRTTFILYNVINARRTQQTLSTLYPRLFAQQSGTHKAAIDTMRINLVHHISAHQAHDRGGRIEQWGGSICVQKSAGDFQLHFSQPTATTTHTHNRHAPTLSRTEPRRADSICIVFYRAAYACAIV